MQYSIDTSVIITAWRDKYPPKVFPALWENIQNLIAYGKIVASEEVHRELEKKEDDIYRWIKRFPTMLIKTSEQIQRITTEILYKYPKLVDQRSHRRQADPFVIALAKVKGYKVLTEEKASGSDKKPNIPDACKGFNISCVNLLKLFEEQKWVF